MNFASFEAELFLEKGVAYAYYCYCCLDGYYRSCMFYFPFALA